MLLQVHQQRGIVTTVTVLQMTVSQIERTDEQGDEHVRVVLVGQRLVHLMHDPTRLFEVRRHDAEQRARYRHYQ